MHPEVVRERPGRCPECGMNLLKTQNSKLKIQKSGHEAHDKHAGHSLGGFLRKFWVSFAFTVPVVLYSALPGRLFGWAAPAFPGSEYLALAFGSVVFFYGGWVFLVGAWREINARLPGMMTLIGLAITAAYLYSVGIVIATFLRQGVGEQEQTLFWELTTLITVMLLGHWIEMKAVQGSQSALRELSKLLPDQAEVIRAGKTEIVALIELKVGDRVLVRPGGKVPADGVVVEGSSEIDESMVTGESKPVAKHLRSEVIAGTINGDGSLTVEVTKIGERTFLAGVMKLVAEAQASKSRLQILSDRAAYYLTVVAVTAGSITFGAWIFARGEFGFAVERLVAVLVIACPHALGLAVPLVASISTTLAARSGFLVRQRLALETARGVHVVLFDKTGTLTKGEYGVTSIIQNDVAHRPEGATRPKPAGRTGRDLDTDDNGILQLAASVDSHSEHFIARALVKEAQARGLALLGVKDFVRVPGKGVRGIVNGATILVGGEAILSDAAAELPEVLRAQTDDFAKQGQTLIFVTVEQELLGAVALADVIRAESREAIQGLKAMGVKVAMITGDSEGVAAWVAEELNIDEYYARVLPGEKAEIVKRIQNPKSEILNSKQTLNSNFQNSKLSRNSDLKIRNLHKRVAFVGDGINDAPALTQADVGIAIGAGTNVAIESAGIILVRNDPRDIVKIIRLSRATYSKMIQNLWWASGYNIVALPLAAGALAAWGIVLQPAIAAVFMSFSTVIVAINAMMLRKVALE